MKYLLSIILAILPFATFAQSSTLLQIDESSFAPVQTDEISGVNIDKIGTDPSRRPCARIKIHINRMTKEEIEALTVRPIGGNAVVTRKTVAADGNRLIVEMTAKEATRFYLLHPTYGESNEVTLNLEGDKEYRLEASLNTTHNVTVTSNIIDAEVYLDDVYKGKIDNLYALTISDVFPGKYHLKVKYGSAVQEKDIDVNSNSFHFRIEVNQEMAKPQYVVFHIEPKNATLYINGKEYRLNTHGELESALKLHNGSYNYVVQANNYHTKEGTFIVNGNKVDKTVRLDPAFGWLKVKDTEILRGATVFIDDYKIGSAPITSKQIPSGKHLVRIVKDLYKTYQEEVTISDNQTTEIAPDLEADYATVTISSAENTFIYINGQSKGKSPWTGNLATGVYTFEARKEGHRSSEISKDITPQQMGEKYEIPSPKPIYGTVDIQSTPSADVYIDNKMVGQTPLEENVIIGEHKISIQKDGYETYSTTVTIGESETKNIQATLSIKSAQSQPTYSSNTKSISFKYTSNTSNSVWVYIDGSLKGRTDRYLAVPYGTHDIVIEVDGKFYGKKVTVSSTSPSILDMTSAPRVMSSQSLSPYSGNYTSSSYSSGSSSGSSGTKQKKKRNSNWNVFNIGLSVDGGYDLWEETHTAGIGLNCRMSRAESLFIPTVGIRYQYNMDGRHFVGIPLGFNLNLVRIFGASWGWYIGLGFEPLFDCSGNVDIYASTSDYDYEDKDETEEFISRLEDSGVLRYAMTINCFGLSFRHHDFNLYLTTDVDTYMFLGCRYTYYF